MRQSSAEKNKTYNSSQKDINDFLLNCEKKGINSTNSNSFEYLSNSGVTDNPEMRKLLLSCIDQFENNKSLAILENIALSRYISEPICGNDFDLNEAMRRVNEVCGNCNSPQYRRSLLEKMESKTSNCNQQDNLKPAMEPRMNERKEN